MIATRGVATIQAGTLNWSVFGEANLMESLCKFGARRSKRRGFVFLSTVLGKHYPTLPSHVVKSQMDLAALLPEENGILFLGLAETAIGLGQGVFEAYLKAYPRSKAVFAHTTRHRLGDVPWYSSKEPHSHAPDHFGYTLTKDSQIAASKAKTLVLVDDEISTGTTLLSLAESLKSCLPSVEKVVFACLTDWSGRLGRSRMQSLGYTVVSLCHGSYSFDPNPFFEPTSPPDAQGNSACMDGRVLIGHGRLGCIGPVRIAPPLPNILGIPKGTRILVLGTGEFMHAPLRLAYEWELCGYDVQFQSTSRSPLATGDGIVSARSVCDHYGDGVPYYLYNHVLANAGWIVACHETPDVPVFDSPGCPVTCLRMGDDGSCVM